MGGGWGGRAAPSGGNGLAEDIAIELGRFRELEVIAPASAFAYREVPVPPERGRPRAGRRASCSAAACGSKARRALRITVRLLECAHGSSRSGQSATTSAPGGCVRRCRTSWCERIVSSLIVGGIEDARLKATRRKRARRMGRPTITGCAAGTDLKQPDLAAIHEARRLFRSGHRRWIRTSPDPTSAGPWPMLNEWACFSWNHWFFLKKRRLGDGAQGGQRWMITTTAPTVCWGWLRSTPATTTRRTDLLHDGPGAQSKRLRRAWPTQPARWP